MFEDIRVIRQSQFFIGNYVATCCHWSGVSRSPEHFAEFIPSFHSGQALSEAKDLYKLREGDETISLQSRVGFIEGACIHRHPFASRLPRRPLLRKGLLTKTASFKSPIKTGGFAAPCNTSNLMFSIRGYRSSTSFFVSRRPAASRWQK